MTHDEYLEKVDYLNKLCYEYHVNNKSLIPDTEYDQLYKSVKDYEDSTKDIAVNSPTQRVGEAAFEHKTKHVYPMYSLENAFDENDMQRFLKRFRNLKDADEFYVDCKMDGLSVELIYEHGELIRCVTRGNGMYGESVTPNAYKISNLPVRIPYAEPIVVRGEVVVSKKAFYDANISRAANKQPLFSNCRNYAAGSLRQDDPEVTAKRNLLFYAWDVKVKGSKLKHNECMEVLKKLGFNIPRGGEVCHSFEEIMNAINAIGISRNDLPYDIDGAVIKQNNIELYSVVGWNTHAPLFSIAYKFRAAGSDTVIDAIKWNIGRTGRLTPVAVIEPININGVNINKVTLNNASYVESNQIGVGTKVSVIRSADVIPKISKIIESNGYHGLPDVCPYCGEKVTKISTDLKCINDGCKGRLIALLTFIIGKDVLNVKGIGDKFIAEAVNSGTITKLTDIFSMMESKSKSVSQELLDKLYLAAKNIAMIQLLTMLSIPGFSKVIASKVVRDVRHVTDIHRLFQSESEMRQYGLSKSVIDHIKEWYADEKHVALLNALGAIELNNC